MKKGGFTHESTYNESKEWYTPREIFRALGITFDLDPCSPGQDIVPWIPAQIHLTIRDDGLTHKWWGNVFMNPPYGSDTPFWMQRLRNHRYGIALVFARADTQWFHDYIPYASAICFIKGRVQFVPADEPDKVTDKKTGKIRDGIPYASLYADGQYKPKDGCGSASMLVAFGGDNALALENSGLGLTIDLISPKTMLAARELLGKGVEEVDRCYEDGSEAFNRYARHYASEMRRHAVDFMTSAEETLLTRPLAVSKPTPDVQGGRKFGDDAPDAATDRPHENPPGPRRKPPRLLHRRKP